MAHSLELLKGAGRNPRLKSETRPWDYWKCPRCKRIAPAVEVMRVTTLYLGLGVPWEDHGRRCTACGYEWGFMFRHPYDSLYPPPRKRKSRRGRTVLR